MSEELPSHVVRLQRSRKIIEDYVRQFDGQMDFSPVDSPDNLDSALFNTDGQPTTTLIALRDRVTSWVNGRLHHDDFLVSLIGSYAGGRPTNSSDIDIHITVPGTTMEERNELYDELFQQVNARKAPDGYHYTKEPGSLDFKIESSPPTGVFFNLSEGEWQSLTLKAE